MRRADAADPAAVANAPGQPVLHRRVATQATAKATMLRALSDPDLPGTTRFTARNDEDFGVAFVDAATVVADIVSFYTDRFVNEHYLRTAGERRSLVELSRLIGYQPRPGLAPTADLVFTLDTSPGAPTASVIPAGTGVQSSPDPGQSPVIYETLADISASPAWNAVRPRRTVPHPVRTRAPPSRSPARSPWRSATASCSGRRQCRDARLRPDQLGHRRRRRAGPARHTGAAGPHRRLVSRSPRTSPGPAVGLSGPSPVTQPATVPTRCPGWPAARCQRPTSTPRCWAGR